jgi:hypothetical protein
LETGESDQPKTHARTFTWVAAAFGVVSLAAGVVAFSGRGGSALRGVCFYACAWAALTSLSWLVAANAHREQAPVRRLAFRFALAAAIAPLVIWLGMREPDIGAGVILVGVVLVLFGREALLLFDWL